MKLSKIVAMCLLAFVAGGAVGAYLTPTDTKTKENAQTMTDKKTTKKQKKKKVTEKPDGTKITEETVTESTGETETVKTETREKIETKGPKTSVQVLAGFDLHKTPTPVYGVAAQRELIGPVSIGAFGLTNGTVGVTLGVSF